MRVIARPAGCCDAPPRARPLPSARRARLVALFRALGDPTRLEVFRFVARAPGPVCVCDVVGRFSVSQPTVSHHLRVLREARLLAVSRRGVWAYYAADPRGLDLLREAVAGLAPGGGDGAG